MGVGGSDGVSLLVSEVVFAAVFLLGGLDYEVGYMEGCLIIVLRGPYNCPGEGFTSSSSESSGYISGSITLS